MDVATLVMVALAPSLAVLIAASALATIRLHRERIGERRRAHGVAAQATPAERADYPA